jgi:2-keto-4-pentenoate hydratase/2-oxohepta-3-ene-1,7-dioic acid hydratase in catechol pathway
MKGFSIGSIFRDNCNTLVIVLGSTVFDLGKLLAASGADSLPSGFGLSEMLDDWATWFPRIKQAVELGESQGSGGIDAYRIADVSEVAWRAPILKPRKLICMGTNYAGHATEVSSDPLKAPYSFIKSSSNTLRGSGATITLLDIANMNDWEVELAVVIGKAARRVDVALAMDYVAGYSIINDVSARDWVASSPKFLGIDWVVGKSIDGYAPMGPTFTPAEFVADPQNLNLELTVNGKVMQRGNTSQMVFNIAEIIAHLSRIMTLEPGDIIASGTPEGTGFGHKPPVWLKDGDIVHCTIDGLGTLENKFVR